MSGARTPDVALITGAAHGIGREVAGQLAGRGWSLALLDVDGDGLATVAEHLRDQGAQVSSFVVDVSDADALRRAVAEAVEALGSVHLCAPLAGVFVLGAWDELPHGVVALSLAVNYVHPVICATTVLRLARERGFATRFLFAGSSSAIRPSPRLGAYATTKAALASFATSFNRELSDLPGFGVTLAVIHPTRTALGTNSRRFLHRHGVVHPAVGELPGLDGYLVDNGQDVAVAVSTLLAAVEEGRAVVHVGGRGRLAQAQRLAGRSVRWLRTLPDRRRAATGGQPSGNHRVVR